MGFIVKNVLIVLAEAQASWSENIAVRMLPYAANTYKEYIDKHKLNLYSTKKIKLPELELFVIYTGDKELNNDTISLADSFFGGKRTIDINVKVITNGKNNDIIAQYVRFTKVINEQIKIYGYTKKTITEAIRICKDEDVLKEYLSRCEEEVIDMMNLLFDQEKVWEAHDKEVLDEGIEIGREEGREEGLAQGIERGKNMLLQQMRALGMSEEQINKILAVKLKEAA